MIEYNKKHRKITSYEAEVEILKTNTISDDIKKILLTDFEISLLHIGNI